MADEFDPYYTWLAIPPEEQPPTHYRLLGVRPFEQNLDVISNAADQRMAFLRTFQVGKRSALSQRLLNEMAAAKGCLLEPGRRKSYDEKLKASQAKPAPAQQPAPSYSPAPAVAPRQPPVAHPLPSATPLAAVDPFADLVSEVQWQPPLPANPAAGSSDDFAEQVVALARRALSHVQESPLAAAAYGVLALGVLMLVGVGLWVTLGNRSQPKSVAAVPVTDTGLPKPSILPPSPQPVPSAERKPLPATPKPAASIAKPSPSPAAAPIPNGTNDLKSGPPESPPETAATSGRAWTPLMNVFPGRFPPPRKAKLSRLTNKLAEFVVGSKELQLWSVPPNTGQQFESPLTISAQSNVQCVCFSRDDGLLAIGTQSHVEVWDLKSQEHWQVAVPAEVVDVVFCGDEKYLAVALQGCPLEVINLGTRKITLRMASTQAEARSLAASDHWLAALTPSGSVSIYDLRRGAAHGDFHASRGVIKAVFMRGASLYAVDDESITTWSVKDRLVTAEWRTPILKSHPVPDDLEVETGLFTQQENGVLSLFQWVNDDTLGRISTPAGKLSIVDIGLDRLLASGPDDRLLLWNLDRIKKSSGLLNPAEEIVVLSRLPRGSVAAILGPKPPTPPTVPASSSSPPPLPIGSSATMTPAQAAERLRALGVDNLPVTAENITFVGFHKSGYTDADAQCLAALPRLTNVHFGNVPVTAKTLEYLKNCPMLQVISLPKCEIGDDDLASLSGLSELKQLSLQETKVTGKGVAHLKGLSEMERLFLPQNVGRELVPYMANFPKLKYMSPFPPDLTDEDMKVIGKLHSLEHLDLQQAKLTAAGYQELANLTEVSNIALPVQTPPGVMVHLTKMKLGYLGFPQSATQKDLGLFQGMTTLRVLRPPRDLNDDGMKLIAGFSGLEDVNLYEAQRITDAGLANLAKMKTLKRISLPPNVGDQGLIHLARCQSLESISIHRSAIVTDKGLQALISLPKLERLDLPSCIDDQAVKTLAKSRNLKALAFHGCMITADGLKSLQEMKHLEDVNLIQVKLTAPGVEAIKSLTGLTSLMIQHCSVPPEEAAAIKSALPKARVYISQ